MINLIFPTSLLFLFNVNVQCCAVPFIYITVLQEKSKWGNVVEGWVIIICFKILACLISGSFFELLFSLFLMEFILSIINIYIIIITIVMVIFLFLLLFLLFWLLISSSINKGVGCISFTPLFDIIIFIIILICFVFSFFCKCMYLCFISPNFPFYTIG